MSANCFVFSCTLGLALCQSALSAILRRLRNSLVRQEMIGLMVKSETKYGIPGKRFCKYIPHSNTFQASGYLGALQKCVNTEKWGWVSFLWWCTKLYSQELEKAKKRKLAEQGMENKEGKNELASGEEMRVKKKTTRDQRWYFSRPVFGPKF